MESKINRLVNFVYYGQIKVLYLCFMVKDQVFRATGSRVWTNSNFIQILLFSARSGQYFMFVLRVTPNGRKSSFVPAHR